MILSKYIYFIEITSCPLRQLILPYKRVEFSGSSTCLTSKQKGQDCHGYRICEHPLGLLVCGIRCYFSHFCCNKERPIRETDIVVGLGSIYAFMFHCLKGCMKRCNRGFTFSFYRGTTTISLSSFPLIISIIWLPFKTALSYIAFKMNGINCGSNCYLMLLFTHRTISPKSVHPVLCMQLYFPMNRQTS